MTKITETEFAKICRGIREDRGVIIKHNPLGTDKEILLWMLMSVLISFLNISETETPCFSGKPDENTYRDAISFILKNRKAVDFDEGGYLSDLNKLPHQDLS